MIIAGLLLATAMAAVSRMSVAALSSSAKLSDRARIEAAINDNIQAMQKEDSYYTDQWIIDDGGQAALDNACSNPPAALSSHLQKVVPELRITTIQRSFDSISIPGILRIVYRFEGPEQQVKTEQRIIEMTPNFAATCYRTR